MVWLRLPRYARNDGYRVCCFNLIAACFSVVKRLPQTGCCITLQSPRLSLRTPLGVLQSKHKREGKSSNKKPLKTNTCDEFLRRRSIRFMVRITNSLSQETLNMALYGNHFDGWSFPLGDTAITVISVQSANQNNYRRVKWFIWGNLLLYADDYHYQRANIYTVTTFSSMAYYAHPRMRPSPGRVNRRAGWRRLIAELHARP
jgi:hypothetical protein